MSLSSDQFPAKNGVPIGAVMVVGGGIAGMQASLDLAEAGFRVYLVEKEPAIGGHMAALDKTFPTNDCAMCTISSRLVETASHPNITLLTNHQLVSLEGEAGHFSAELQYTPRYIDLTKCTGCGDCATACPVLLSNIFNGKLDQRKAAYKLYPQAVPNAYAIEKKGIAPCRDACPAGQRAQGYIALIRAGRYGEALRVIKLENPFPGICGRVCNHRCETACNRTLVDEPIAIAALKRFVTDQVYATPYVPPEPAIRKFEQRVAIIGSGPAGLTAARDLVLAGFGVTMFEALPVAGGMMRVGIPEYRLPSWIVNREVQEIIDLGIELRLNTRVDSLDDLLAEGFSALLIAVGAQESKRLPIPNANHPDVLTATCFLREVRLGNSANLKGKHMLVLGGGNVAMDCARTAIRMGARQVDLACLEERATMSADLSEIQEAEEEGLHIYAGRSFNQILTANEQVVGVEALLVNFMRFEDDGRLTLKTEPGSEHTLACDMVIFAIGQRPDLAFASGEGNINLSRQGLAVIDHQTYETSRKGVFAAGDAVSGTAFIVDAIASGHKAAGNIINYLHGDDLPKPVTNTLPVVRMTQTEIDKRLAEGEISQQPRHSYQVLEPELRRLSFHEVIAAFSEAQAQAEAERCLQCGVCAECLTCVAHCGPGAINHSEQPRHETLEVGAVILATGFETYDPRTSASEYGFGRLENVVTSMQFERMLSPSGPYKGHLQRPSDGIEPKRIAWIQCVGSRQVERN